MIKFEFWVPDDNNKPSWLAHSIVEDNLDLAINKLERILGLEEITQNYIVKAIEIIIPL